MSTKCGEEVAEMIMLSVINTLEAHDEVAVKPLYFGVSGEDAWCHRHP